MASPFEEATRIAISEIILKHVTPSKFGHFLSVEAHEELCDDLFSLLMTSRRLKAAGDRILAEGLGHAGASKRTVPNAKLR